MRLSFIRPIILSTAIGLAYIFVPAASNAASTGQVQSQSSTIENHFTPRPSVATRIDFDALDFMLGETVLYMGPSARIRGSLQPPRLGTRLTSSHTSPHRMEGNKVTYSQFTDAMKSEMKAYAEELVEIGNRLDIPSLSNNEQLAYWINLHNMVLITTISENYPPPHRRPTRIKPIEGSSAKLHDAKLITIDGYALSLRDIREKIVFPNWKNKDVPYAFHLGYLGSPSMANYAYSAPKLKSQLKMNADEFVNSLRAYHNGKLNPYIRDVSPWYYPDINQDLDGYFRKRMRHAVYAEYKSSGIRKIFRENLTLADMTGGFGRKSSIAPLQSSANESGLGANIDQFLEQRANKINQLQRLEWFKRGFVTIEDTPTTDDGEAIVE